MNNKTIVNLNFAFFLVFTSIIFFNVNLAAAIAAAATEEGKISKIMSISSTLPGDAIFYTWSSQAVADKRFKEKIWSDAEFDATIEKTRNDPERGVSPRSLAGRGIYLAENPYSSSIYGSEIFTNEGALIEVKIDGGIPFIDLTNDDKMAELRRLGITADDIYKLNPPLLIKYEKINSWWIMKTNKGIHFRPLTGHNLVIPQIEYVRREIKYKTPRSVFMREVALIPERIRNESLEDSLDRALWANSNSEKINFFANLDPALIYYSYDSLEKLEFHPIVLASFFGKSKNYSKISTPSKNASGLEMITIEWPRYNYRGRDRYLSVASDMHGVCKHFGFKSSLSYQVGGQSLEIISCFLIRETPVTIMMDKRGIPAEVSNTSSTVIKSIDCL
ncbi:MAG: hypothetical protein HQK53_08915 [Oligoflexia bacterium]|nr:hypothetical protein [Oligoflexia bacterium]